jgi:hypothetical protein
MNAMECAVWHGIFQNRVEEREHAIEIFQKHIEEVQRIVPPERLLVFEARQGWEPLCSFLQVPVPVDKPYPHRHKGSLVRALLKHTGIMNYRSQ